MKHLILIRHAESVEKVTGSPDEQRELTLGGIHQAAQVGAFLRSKIHVDIIFSSRANRAHSTAQIIAEQLSLENEDVILQDDLYQGSVGTLYSVIRDADQYQNIAVVAHNPTISYFSEFITGSDVDEMRPASVLILKVDVGNWKDIQKGSAAVLDRFDA